MARRRVDVFLAPGEFGVYAQPLSVKTVLGSCVAICLWDPRRRIGGLNHYLLPAPTGAEGGPRFGSVACRELIAGMRAAGCEPTKLWAAVIGGGAPVGRMGDASVGASNTRVALATLSEHGIRVRRQDTGGAFGRKLLFDTADGTLWVRRLQKQLIRPAG